ncbi:MAG: SDR family oxidoreductase, partial [Pseudomonadota bacterium]|nr:SDR family oxidoreductase [Pseudomonadota bacterium]
MFASKGWRVGLVARGEQGLEDTRKDVVARGSAGCVAPADVSDSEALESAAAKVERELGVIDVWVNDAGVSVVAPFTEITADEFRRVTDVTYMGTVNGVRTALKHMRPRDHGTIVNVASAIAYRGIPLMAPYSGAKYAVRGFTEAVRSELIHDRSRVHLTMVHPPSVNTPFFSHSPNRWTDEAPRPPPPVYQPEIIADAIYFAATHRRREVQVGGQTVQFAAMNKVVPAFTDWVLGQVGYAIQKSKNPNALRLRDPNLFAPTDNVHDVRGP